MKLHGVKVDSKLKETKRSLGEKTRVNPTAFKGYPGLEHTARQICDYIPKCKIFVEPFAGLGRISRRVEASRYVLNDMSDFALEYLKRNFEHEITKMDYSQCIKTHDSKDTLFFLDPPWHDEIYDVNPLTANTKPCREIYDDLKESLPKIQGDWIIAGKVNGPLKNWKYHHLEIKSKKNYLFGHKARTYLVSNMPFVNHHQQYLFGED